MKIELTKFLLQKIYMLLCCHIPTQDYFKGCLATTVTLLVVGICTHSKFGFLGSLIL